MGIANVSVCKVRESDSLAGSMRTCRADAPTAKGTPQTQVKAIEADAMEGNERVGARYSEDGCADGVGLGLVVSPQRARQAPYACRAICRSGNGLPAESVGERPISLNP